MRPGATGCSTWGRSHLKGSRAQPRDGGSPTDTFVKPGSSCTWAHPLRGLPSHGSDKFSREAAVTKNHVGSTQQGWLGWATSHREGAHGHVPAHSEASLATTSSQRERVQVDCGSFCGPSPKDGFSLCPSFFSSSGLLHLHTLSLGRTKPGLARARPLRKPRSRPQ